jgi:hypothetical protein
MREVLRKPRIHASAEGLGLPGGPVALIDKPAPVVPPTRSGSRTTTTENIKPLSLRHRRWLNIMTNEMGALLSF